MMRSRHDQLIDGYVKTLMDECGERSPIRRQAFEEDIGYALQVMEPFSARYREAMRYDIFAVDSSFEKAMTALNDAKEVLERFGVAVALPERIENPVLIEAESAMALVDMLRSLGALSKTAGAMFVETMVGDFLHKNSAGGSEAKPTLPKVCEFIRRYIDVSIPERVLDKIAFDEGYLEKYLSQL